MHDMRAHLEKLRSDAEDCALVSHRATDAGKRELFARLSEHLNRLAEEVEWALAEKEAEDERRRELEPGPAEERRDRLAHSS